MYTVLADITAATTLIVGILHMNKTRDIIKDNISNTDLLFLIEGMAQVFLNIPIIRRWGKT